MTIPASRRLDFTEVPVIDIESLREGIHSTSTVETIRSACRDVGFLYIKNHGVSYEVVDTLHQQAKLFFSQPMEEKKQILICRSSDLS
ncbi:MAG: hypothetical protein GKR96_06210 [Gammaproteobacteria bacterium]|nr:hypothetical protein [Gammaproteobacteria bacterium]